MLLDLFWSCTVLRDSDESQGSSPHPTSPQMLKKLCVNLVNNFRKFTDDAAHSEIPQESMDLEVSSVLVTIIN